jgi:HK97 family phage major capsid protein
MPIETKDLEPVLLGITEIKGAANEAKTAATEAKNAADTAKTGVIELKEWQVKKDEADKKNQEAIDSLVLSNKRVAGVFGAGSIKSFEGEIEELLNSKKNELKARHKFNLELERKAVGDISATNTTGSYFITPDTRSGVILKPYEAIHMRNILPVGRTGSSVVRYVRDNGGEGGPAPVAMGTTKPQMDRDLSIEDANVRKIASYIRVPEEMIEDIDYLTTFLTNIGTQETIKVEDAQIIYGDGTGQNLSGLFTNATAFAAGAAVIGASSNRYDVLRAARLQLRKAQRVPSFALVSPFDYFMLTSVKDTTNNYVLQGGGNGLIPNIDGVPIIETTAVTDGDFLMGDRNAAEIDFRTNLSIRFFEQDQNNAIQNMVTIVIEERLALPIYYTSGFVKGTFAAAITDLTS